jgi:RNA polymerase sigma factor (sigma-70 family)
MPPPPDPRAALLLRDLAPQVLGAVVRRFRDFAAAEDAVQEALLAAATQWPASGVPTDPRAWLVTVASRRLVDQVRADSARRRREAELAEEPAEEQLLPPADARDPAGADDTLVLLFLCCHPALTDASAIALTLRAVGGLTTAEIARAFFVPEPTMAQRISRAKQTIATSGGRFELPSAQETAQRLAAVLHVLYLIFNEGYVSSSGPELQRADLASEAIRLTRLLHGLLAQDHSGVGAGGGEVAGLLALMLLTDARRAARTGPAGELIPLDQQDRRRWDRGAINEGVGLLQGALARGSVGSYQLQAAIAALHDEAPDAERTDWPQILALYGLLARMSDNPMVALNQAIAAAMVHGPAVGLQRLDALAADPRLANHHRLDAVRAHLLERAGDRRGAIQSYQLAARRTTSLPERSYLLAQAARLDDEDDKDG